jgi:hypothetical protein
MKHTHTQTHMALLIHTDENSEMYAEKELSLLAK